ncbi:MAG: tRNA(Ile)-lysidine synthetase, partial [Ilumatobacteraceae bacterium]
AAVLFGNSLRWDVEYLARQYPVLPARAGFPKKAKPLVRLTERETAAWCIVRGIDYLVDECPMAAGNRHLAYKDALNRIEAESPGSKASFYLGFLDNMAPILRRAVAETEPDLAACTRCGAPSSSPVCAFCRISETSSAHAPVPVEVLLARRSRRRDVPAAAGERGTQ